MNSLPLFVWLSLTHSERSRAIVLLFVPERVAVVGVVPAGVTLVSVNATFTLTVAAPSSRAVPSSPFTKSRPLVNSSWIMY